MQIRVECGRIILAHATFALVREVLWVGFTSYAFLVAKIDSHPFRVFRGLIFCDWLCNIWGTKQIVVDGSV